MMSVNMKTIVFTDFETKIEQLEIYGIDVC